MRDAEVTHGDVTNVRDVSKIAVIAHTISTDRFRCMSPTTEAALLAGIPVDSGSLFLKVGIAAGDPAAWLAVGDHSIVIVRDIEKQRAAAIGTADRYASPADFAPPNGLDPDRAIATAQAVAECFRREGATRVRTDRSLPFVFAWHLMQAGIELEFDAELGVLDRRVKSESQLDALAHAQLVTENSMEMACRLVAASVADRSGTLHSDGAPLTSERVRAAIAHFLLDEGFTLGHGAIVATAPDAADCHHAGAGTLQTGVPVIIDIFPRDESSRFWGDCTRTVVHGTPSDTVAAMHLAVIKAKAAGCAQLCAGNTAASVHQAATDVLESHGFRQSRGEVSDEPTIQHGTGHGIGLDIHEPLLLDDGGGALLANEVYTVEPGLYGRNEGGVRIEDMLAVTNGEPRNFNRLHEGLDWS
ncbi:MAG: M24 family metallopeptidase [Planctomycetota bacterium]